MLICRNKNKNKSEMAQKVKVLAKSDDLSSIPGTHRVAERLPQVFLWHTTHVISIYEKHIKSSGETSLEI